MQSAVGVIFKEKGHIYYFAYQNEPLKIGMEVIVETDKGLQFGWIKTEVKEVAPENLGSPLKPIVRIATKEDKKKHEQNLKDEQEALKVAKKQVEQLHLPMRMIDANFLFDRKQLLFHFVADDRVDFRELLKELASVFKCRIELRQIGPRDKSKIVGGLGSCGLPLCCSSFLGEFDGVSINMAKNQMLAINIDKISGACGRLLCCLKYEDDTYTKEKQRFPKIGSKVKYDNKIVKVTGLNVISDLVKIEHDGNISFVSLDEIQILPPREHKHEPRSR